MILLVQCSFIAMSVTLLFSLIASNRAHMKDGTPFDRVSVEAEAPFFKRLPLELGKSLISIQAQDHYLNVKTQKGSHMVLLRMGDAVEELTQFDGMQVHRSWWVANDHVKSVQKSQGKTLLILSDGEEVPVSRGYAKEVNRQFG